MEDPKPNNDNQVYIQVKNRTNDIQEDDIESNILPEVNLNEPGPDDPILIWAERHIDEKPNLKLELIEELRDMIYERGECEPYRTDDAFLLRFLRARNFIVRKAHRLFVNYCTFRETNPNFFTNLNFSKLVHVGDAGIVNVPPYVDQDSRRLLYLKLGNWDPSQFSTDELFQSIIFLVQAAVLEPRHQILGGICILDVDQIATSHILYMTPTIAKYVLEVSYSSLPHRIEAIHIVNVSRVFDYAFSMIKGLLSDFMKKRIHIHNDLESLHKYVNPKYLSKRYGGIHKEYPYSDWLNILSTNEELIEELESYGYQGREFIKALN